MDGKGLQERYHGDPVLPSAGHMTSTKSEQWPCKQVELGSEGKHQKHLYKPWLHRMIDTAGQGQGRRALEARVNR